MLAEIEPTWYEDPDSGDTFVHVSWYPQDKIYRKQFLALLVRFFQQYTFVNVHRDPYSRPPDHESEWAPLYNKMYFTDYYDTAVAISHMYFDDEKLANMFGREMFEKRSKVQSFIQDFDGSRGWDLIARNKDWQTKNFYIPNDRADNEHLFTNRWLKPGQSTEELQSIFMHRVDHEGNVLENTLFLLRDIVKEATRSAQLWDGQDLFHFIDPDIIFSDAGVPFGTHIYGLGKYWMTAWMLVALNIDPYKLEERGYLPHLLQYLFSHRDIPDFKSPEYIVATAYFVNLWKMLIYMRAMKITDRYEAAMNIQNTAVFMAWFPGHDMTAALAIHGDDLRVKAGDLLGVEGYKVSKSPDYLFYRLDEYSSATPLSRKPWMICFLAKKKIPLADEPQLMDKALPLILAYMYWLIESAMRVDNQRTEWKTLVNFIKQPVKLLNISDVCRMLGVNLSLELKMKDFVTRGLSRLPIYFHRDPEAVGTRSQLKPPAHYSLALTLKTHMSTLLRPEDRFKRFWVFPLSTSCKWMPMSTLVPTHIVIVPSGQAVARHQLPTLFVQGFQLPQALVDESRAMGRWQHWYNLWVEHSLVAPKELLVYTLAYMQYRIFREPRYDLYRSSVWTDSPSYPYEWQRLYRHGQIELNTNINPEEAEWRLPMYWELQVHFQVEPVDGRQDRVWSHSQQPFRRPFTSTLDKMEFGVLTTLVDLGDLQHIKRHFAWPETKWHNLSVLFDDPYTEYMERLERYEWTVVMKQDVRKFLRSYMDFFLAQQKVIWRQWLSENRLKFPQAFRHESADLSTLGRPQRRGWKNRYGWTHTTERIMDMDMYLPARTYALLDEFLTQAHFNEVRARIVKHEWYRDDELQPTEFLELNYLGYLPYPSVTIAVLRRKGDQFWWRDNLNQIIREGWATQVWRQYQAAAFLAEETLAYTGFSQVHSLHDLETRKRISDLGKHENYAFAPQRGPVPFRLT